MMSDGLAAFLAKSQSAILLYFLATNLLYLALFTVSILAILRHIHSMSYRNLLEISKSRLAPPISILVPAYNEATGIISSVKALLELNYPTFEVIIINDGSHDETLQKLIEAFGLSKTKRVYHQTIATKTVKGIYVAR